MAAGFSAASAHNIVTVIIIPYSVLGMLSPKRYKPEHRRDSGYYIAYLLIVNYITFELGKMFPFFGQPNRVFPAFSGIDGNKKAQNHCGLCLFGVPEKCR
jgi:hypothetical protein